MYFRDFPRDFQAGTLVWREDVHLGVVSHYGVALQSYPVPAVAHIDKGYTGHLKVKVESLEEFAQGRQVKYEPAAAPVALSEMWDRVNSVAQSKRPFGLLAFGEAWNCESFARFVKSGLPVSEQAEGFKGVLAVAALVGVVLVLATSD